MRKLMLVAAAATLAMLTGACRRDAEQADPAATAAITKGVDRSHAGQAAPDAEFTDPDGEQVTLADLGGSPALVNLWATWCAPCKKELPTLDALAKRHLADGKLRVIAVSQDVGPQPSVEAALEDLGTTELGAYHDPKMALSGALRVQVMPTTILYGSDGRELWRYVGDLDWSGAEAAKLLAEAAVPQAR